MAITKDHIEIEVDFLITLLFQLLCVYVAIVLLMLHKLWVFCFGDSRPKSEAFLNAFEHFYITNKAEPVNGKQQKEEQ